MKSQRITTLLLLAGVVAAAPLAAQTPRLAFEVATVKPADLSHDMSISRAGNRLVFSNYSLEMLILWAYDIRSDRLAGKLKGLDSVRYDVVAVAPQEPSVPGRLNRMAQTLLAERFMLVVHRETRELSHYAMVVDKSGAKVHAEALSGPAGQNPFRMTASGHLTGAKVSADMLAKVLTDIVGQFVEDRTELKGVFDFTLDWIPETQPGGNGPSIFTAVQEQLGFRLDARKGPVEVVVIDNVATTPTEN